MITTAAEHKRFSSDAIPGGTSSDAIPLGNSDRARSQQWNWLAFWVQIDIVFHDDADDDDDDW